MEFLMTRMGWKCAAALTFATLVAAPALAQESGGPGPRGYVSMFGAPVWTGGNSTGSVMFEGGARVAPHLMLFGTLGHFSDLQADLQPSLAAETTALSNDGIGVTGSGTLPAWYGLGGLRAEIPVGKHALPYALGGLGTARLKPSEQFAYASGMMPDGSIPTVGTNVTSALMTAGTLTAPTDSTAFMYTLGGGLELPVAQHWGADVGYRYSRIAADTSLSTEPIHTNAVTFGFGYRF
jgi:opacity protein-like surface antigen